MPLGTVCSDFTERILLRVEVFLGVNDAATLATGLSDGAAIGQLVIGVTIYNGAVCLFDLALAGKVALRSFGDLVDLLEVQATTIHTDDAASATVRIHFAVASSFVCSVACLTLAGSGVGEVALVTNVTAVVAVTGALIFANAAFAYAGFTFQTAAACVVFFAGTACGSFGTDLTKSIVAAQSSIAGPCGSASTANNTGSALGSIGWRCDRVVGLGLCSSVIGWLCSRLGAHVVFALQARIAICRGLACTTSVFASGLCGTTHHAASEKECSKQR